MLIDELHTNDLSQFEKNYVQAQKPVVIRGLVNDWPIVGDGKQSLEYLRNYVSARRFNVIQSAATESGTLGYNADFSSLNFTRKQLPYEYIVEKLLMLEEHPDPQTIAVQSAYLDSHFSGLEDELTQDILPCRRPRIWLGNRTKVAAHFDDADNLACIAAGERTFTLFPPDQIENLYIGPLDNTPAGTPVSTAPIGGGEQYPKLDTANSRSLSAKLSPGDAIYIPTLWWHQVEAHSSINVLVNYWSGGAIESPEEFSAMDALLAGLIAFDGVPTEKRKAWQKIINYYLFNEQLSLDHIPPSSRGLLGGITPSIRRKLTKHLIQKLENEQLR